MNDLKQFINILPTYLPYSGFQISVCCVIEKIFLKNLKVIIAHDKFELPSKN